MFTIRFHGRGGQGIKTAGHVLGSAFFIEGFEVQDAPRYGAERRGAPMAAYVRADRRAINARGIIQKPGLVVVADDSLVPIPAAGVLAGINENTVLVIVSHEPETLWRDRLNLKGSILVMPPLNVEGMENATIGVACAGAAASLSGAINRDNMIAAIQQEIGKLGANLLDENLTVALKYYDRMIDHRGMVKQTDPESVADYTKPAWIDLPLEAAELSAPVISGAQTSTLVRTGLWRTQRPVIAYEHCHQCWWVCSSFCPDSAIAIDDKGFPAIDYDHCKGCLICVAQCPSHAIAAISEAEAQQLEQAGEPT